MKTEQRLITIQTNDGPEQLLAETLGLLAVHPSWVGEGYAITHLPTGYELTLRHGASESDALEIMRRLQVVDWDWTWTDTPEPIQEQAREIVRGYRQGRAA